MDTATGQRDDTICRKRFVGCLHLGSRQQGKQHSELARQLEYKWDPRFGADKSGSLRRVNLKRNRIVQFEMTL